MLLNSYILAENMDGVQSKSLHSDPMKASLRYVTVWDARIPLFSDCAYVSTANALEGLTPPVSPYVIISIGQASRRFSDDPNCDLICCRSTFSIHILISIIHDVFKKYNEWEQALISALVEEKQLDEFCRLSLPIFRTPVIVYSSNLEIIGVGEEGDIYRLPDEFSKSECDFLPVERGDAFSADPKFYETFQKRSPQVYKAISGVTCLYTNIFIDDEFEARIVIEHMLRDTNESDWIPISILAQYVRNYLQHSKFNHYGNLTKLKYMIKNDVFGDAIADRKKLEFNMEQIGWKLGERYMCAVIEPYISGLLPGEWIQYEGSFLEIMFEGCIAFEQSEKLLLICNLRVADFSVEGFLSSFEVSLKKHQMKAGVSTEFDNFYNLPAFHTQALAALETGEKLHSLERIFYFPEVALDYVLAHGIFSLPHIALIPSDLCKMMEYDKSKNSEYCRTLAVYLEQNMNIERTIEKLHIHRSTFKYRIERIHAMLPGLDFCDYRVRLYYQLMFEIIKTI